MPRRRTMQRPNFERKKLREIYGKTRGYCNWCGKKLAFTNYGKLGRKGSWEIDHSNPLSKGGTDYLRNLVPSCPICNRSKGTKRLKAYRKKSWLEQILGL